MAPGSEHCCESRKLSETGNFFLPRSRKGNERSRPHCQLIGKGLVGWVGGGDSGEGGGSLTLYVFGFL